MPIFEYRCKKCEEKFEVLVLSSQAETIKCEKCGSDQAEQLFSSFAANCSGDSAPSGCPASSQGGFT